MYYCIYADVDIDINVNRQIVEVIVFDQNNLIN